MADGMETIELQDGEELPYTEQDVIAALHEGNAGVLDAWYRQQLPKADESFTARIGLEQKKAELLHIAGRDADATGVLKNALTMAKGAGDAELQVMLEKRLLQLEGKPVPTIRELSPVELRRQQLRMQGAAIQQRLIALQAHDSREARDLGPEETAKQVIQLKAQLQDLIDREAQLR